jgi:hypothetical protein
MISINANFKEKNILATIAKKYNITLIYVFGSQVGTAINILGNDKTKLHLEH